MDTNSTISNDGLAPTRAQYIQIHGSDSCIKRLKADLQERTDKAVRAALWSDYQKTYIERTVGEYLDDMLTEASSLFVTDKNGHCVVTAGYNGVTTQFEIIARNEVDCSLDVVIDVDTLKKALCKDPVVVDALSELALAGKVKVNVAGLSALTLAYRRYILEFQPIDIRDMSWMLNK